MKSNTAWHDKWHDTYISIVILIMMKEKMMLVLIFIIIAKNYQTLTIVQEVVVPQQPSEVETITTVPIS